MFFKPIKLAIYNKVDKFFKMSSVLMMKFSNNNERNPKSGTYGNLLMRSTFS